MTAVKNKVLRLGGIKQNLIIICLFCSFDKLRTIVKYQIKMRKRLQVTYAPEGTVALTMEYHACN